MNIFIKSLLGFVFGIILGLVEIYLFTVSWIIALSTNVGAVILLCVILWAKFMLEFNQDTCENQVRCIGHKDINYL